MFIKIIIREANVEPITASIIITNAGIDGLLELLSSNDAPAKAEIICVAVNINAHIKIVAAVLLSIGGLAARSVK